MMAWQSKNCKEMDEAFKNRAFSGHRRAINQVNLPKLCSRIADSCDPKFQKLDRFFKLQKPQVYNSMADLFDPVINFGCMTTSLHWLG